MNLPRLYKGFRNEIGAGSVCNYLSGMVVTSLIIHIHVIPVTVVDGVP